MSKRIEFVGEQSLPPPDVSPREFLTDVAPVLELSPQEVNKMARHPLMEANPYDLLSELVDKVARAYTDEGDKDFLLLVKTVIQGFQQYEDVKDALHLEGYTFEEDQLPFIVESIASWVCNNLVEVAAPVRRKRQPPPPPKPASKPAPVKPPRTPASTKAVHSGPRTSPSRASSPKSSKSSKPAQGDQRDEQSEATQPATPVSERVYSSTFFRYRYMKNGRPALLAAEEEVELGKIIEVGVLAEEKLAHMSPATRKESLEARQLRRDLSTLVAEGRRAFDFFVMANERLAWSLASRRSEKGLGRDDLGAMAMRGLMKAVEMFDYTRGYKFSTYASWWIRQSIDRGIADTSRNIRLPFHVHELLESVKRVERELLSDLGRQPTPEEVAKELNLTREQLAEKLEGTDDTVSLDLPIGYDPNSSTLLDFIKDRKLPDVASTVGNELINQELHRRLKTVLTQREQIALQAIIEDADPKYQLSTLFNMNPAAVDKLIRRARAKLAHPSADINSMISFSGGDWRQYAICRDTDHLAVHLDFFALPNTVSEAEAKATCRHCPAMSACLSFALERSFVDGVWGGMSEKERMAALVRNKNKRIPTLESDTDGHRKGKERFF